MVQVTFRIPNFGGYGAQAAVRMGCWTIVQFFLGAEAHARGSTCCSVVQPRLRVKRATTLSLQRDPRHRRTVLRELQPSEHVFHPGLCDWHFIDDRVPQVGSAARRQERRPRRQSRRNPHRDMPMSTG